MKPYLLSLAIGLLVGVIYALFNVRSPAPPVIALVGLLGILVGEQLPPLVKKLMQTEAAPVSWLHHQVKPHMFGELPKCAEKSAVQESRHV
ncbi:XapX domain-containing protein [Paucibacter sp. O1-1]|uniref:XapX domain-containing protein n=1 Tax=Roseateles TaxID=93681 RepID=UPI0010F774E6|nr:MULTISPECIES: XapX domain-containing protein [unclassified Roseateles]MCU7375256.1 XapX domain-containing protein [Paucibacter sp. O1-1]MCZ7881166.1 XapX domain-containing protein [Paucibacter sp. M5-1]MDA3830263.1 XapX domain-containing protein [Paucibacter sp. O1-1]MDC6168222.1 XapX domain-containing protein [Paucibacter sp. XJ19-41]